MSSPSSNAASSSGEIYGLGIRLGLYLHWTSLFLLRVTGYGSWASLRRVRTSCFLICCVISAKFLIDFSGPRSSLPDFLVLFYLIVVLFLPDSYNLYDKRNDPDTGFRYELQPDAILFSQNLLGLTANAFAAWYWIDGIYYIPGGGGDSQMQAALLQTFSIYGTQWRRFAAAFAIMTAIFFSILCFLHRRGLFYGQELVEKQQQYKLSKKHACPNFFPFENKVDFFGPILRPRFPNGVKFALACSTEPRSVPKSVSLFVLRLVYWFAIHLGCPGVAIISVERMIQVNELQTEPVANSTGQILVLAMGIANLVASLCEIASDYWHEMKRSPICLQDTLSMHTYFSSRCPEEDDLEPILEDLLSSHKSWCHVPGLFMLRDQNHSLASLLRAALLQELVKKLRATVMKENASPPIEKYIEIRATERLCSCHRDNGGFKDVALTQAAAHGDLRALQILLGDYEGDKNWNLVSFSDKSDEASEILMPIPETVEDIRQLCHSIQLAEFAADEGAQWETCRLLEKYHTYLREKASQIKGNSESASTATLSESIEKESPFDSQRSGV